jgi:hypothetical protein
MHEFNRGITNGDFIHALNELYKNEDSFWYRMVNDKELFIAIREDYLNVYYKGQSVCRLYYKNGIKGATHKRYLGVEEPGYFHSENGIFLNQKSEIKSLTEIAQLKGNITIHVGKEKDESYTEIINNEKCIIDVEIAFVSSRIDEPIKKSKYKISSIDYLALEMDRYDEQILVFYEAKHFTNSEIRSRTEPKVLKQIKRYEKVLLDHNDEIIRSYELVIKNLLDLHILDKRNYKWAGSNKKDLKIDPEPKLIIFDNKQISINEKHIQKLQSYFGSRLILKGYLKIKQN